MVWPCEKEEGELRRKEYVKHGSTWNERKEALKATLDGHHQRSHAVCCCEGVGDTGKRDLEDIYICRSDPILNGRSLKKKKKSEYRLFVEIKKAWSPDITLTHSSFYHYLIRKIVFQLYICCLCPVHIPY